MSIHDKCRTVGGLIANASNPDLLREYNVLLNDVFDLDSQRRDLLNRVKELEDKLALREQLVFERNMYWLKEGENPEGPYCPRCYDGEQALRRMVEFQGGTVYGCPACVFILSSDGNDLTDTFVFNRFRRTLMRPEPAK